MFNHVLIDRIDPNLYRFLSPDRKLSNQKHTYQIQRDFTPDFRPAVPFFDVHIWLRLENPSSKPTSTRYLIGFRAVLLLQTHVFQCSEVSTLDPSVLYIYDHCSVVSVFGAYYLGLSSVRLSEALKLLTSDSHSLFSVPCTECYMIIVSCMQWSLPENQL